MNTVFVTADSSIVPETPEVRRTDSTPTVKGIFQGSAPEPDHHLPDTPPPGW